MRKKLWRVGLVLGAMLAIPGKASSQAAQQNGTLAMSGRTGQVPVLRINDKSYVEIDALARLANASLAFKGNQITLTMPASGANTPTSVRPESQLPNPGFSKDFMKAGIELGSTIREWRTALFSAVQNGYPVTDDMVGGYRGPASTNLKLASVAVSTDSDRNAFQLVSNLFDNMEKLSNKITAARKNMNYVTADALRNDPLNQQILNCTRSLASMAASGQFQDDGSCH